MSAAQETILAIERGEAHGRCVFSYSALKIAKPDWLRDNKINVLVLTAVEKSPDFPGVPAVVDLVSKPEDRQLLELMVGARRHGAAVRRAAWAAREQGHAAAARLRRHHAGPGIPRRGGPDPGRSCARRTGEDVQELVKRIYATPRPVIERVKKLLAP